MLERRLHPGRARSLFYGRVTVADVPEIVEGIVSGERVERLVLTLGRPGEGVDMVLLARALINLPFEQRLQQVPVAMLLVFGAMAQQRHSLVLRKMLQEAQSEFLAVILDSLVAAIDRAVLAQFLAISVAEFGPRDFSRQKFIPELLARPEIGHPNIVAIFRQAAAPAARRENSQTVIARFDRGVNGLCLEHGLGLDTWIRATRK